MAISRYGAVRLIRDPSREEPVHFATYDLPELLKGYLEVDWFTGQAVIQHVWVLGDRMDKLASKYYGDDEYWWVIALVNKINYPLGVQPGTVLKFPVAVDSVLEKLNLR
jgi:nucleoid-associated protein YgaU